MAEVDVQNDEEPADPYDVPIRALSTKTTFLISSLLNPIKIIPTEKGLPRDWQGLAELVGIGGEQMPYLHSNSDPTLKLLQKWSDQNNKSSTIINLIKFLEELDRFDVIDDVIELIDIDIKQCKEKPANGEVMPLIADSDRYVLTVDDINRINQGLDPQKYDAFVLFAEEDIDFATELIETMEKQRNLKLCVKDRDLVGGAFEHDCIIKLIADRCNRLVVIISPAFFVSAANKFFVSFAQAIGIDQQMRKIIPCIYSHCEIPAELKCYFMLDYKRKGRLWNFWDKLYESIRTPERDVPKKTNLNRSVSHQLRTNIVINHSRTSNRTHLNTLKPKREGVTFNSMVNLSDNSVEPQLNPSPSLTTVSIEGKKNKSKMNWIKKLLPNSKRHKSSGDHLPEKTSKMKFWQKHSKQKVAVAI